MTQTIASIGLGGIEITKAQRQRLHHRRLQSDWEELKFIKPGAVALFHKLLQSDWEELKYNSSNWPRLLRRASIGLGGIEIFLVRAAGHPPSQLQSDWEELKYQGGAVGREGRRGFNRTGRN